MSLLQAAGFTILPNIGGWVNGYLSATQIKRKDGTPSWYDSLKKPSFTPPNWVFGPVWTSIYTGIGYASYLVYRDGGGFQGSAQLPLALYGSQLLLNWAWTPIFFEYHQLKWSTVTILALSANVVACGVSFYGVNPIAGYLFIPYAAWLALASALSISIWKLNKDKDGVRITEVADADKTK